MIHSAPPRRQGVTHAKPFQPDTFCDQDEDDMAAMMMADAMHIRKRRQKEGLEKAGRTEPPPHVEQPWMILAARVIEHLRTSGKIVSIGRGDYILAPEHETPRE